MKCLYTDMSISLFFWQRLCKHRAFSAARRAQVIQLSEESPRADRAGTGSENRIREKKEELAVVWRRGQKKCILRKQEAKTPQMSVQCRERQIYYVNSPPHLEIEYATSRFQNVSAVCNRKITEKFYWWWGPTQRIIACILYWRVSVLVLQTSQVRA